MRVPHGCAGSPLPEGTRIRRPLGPSGIDPPARPARGGRCARRLETRPSVAVPQGSPADPGADRRRRRGLPLSYRIHRHDRARRADDDADARRVRGIRAGDGEGAHPGRPQSGPRARAPWRATAEVHSGATRGNPQHARRRPIGGRGRPIVPGAPRDDQPAQRCVASNRGSLNCPVHATFENLAENRPTVYSGLLVLLRDGHIAGAGLDVLPVEPPVDPIPEILRAYREREPGLEGRLVITPHAAWFTPQSERDTRVKSAETMRAALLTNRPQNVITPEMY